MTGRWEFVKLVRRPSGFGAARMTLKHPTEGKVEVDLMPSELHTIATQALLAMDPQE